MKSRILFAAQPQLLAPLLQVIHRIITSFLIKQAGLKRTAANTGAVTLIQRFGSAANLNIRPHCLVLDGVYRNSTAVFHEVAAPTLKELQALLARIITRIIRWLTKQGFLIEEQDRTYLGEADRESALLPLQAASCTYRTALGPRAGHKVLSLQSVASPDKSSTPDLCAKLHGFSLHASVRWGADQRKELEHLCRYITRPAIANERLKRNRAGQVVLQLKSAFKDGTTHIVMSPPDEARQARDDHAAREQAMHAELEQTRQHLQTALEAARQALARITSMESSKFWKLRRIWFRLKRCVGLGMNE